MAMGMSWLSTPAISIIAILATIGIFIYLFKTMDQANIPYLLCMGFILGGALGNITDRLVMGIIEGYGGVLDGHVVDFLHFTLVIGDRPVFPYIFNFADVAISTSIIVLLLFGKWILPDEAVDKKEIEQPEIAEEMMGEKNNEPGETA
jgi:signal peptidase II